MSCFGGREEQIYLVELTVERLLLAATKYNEDFSESLPLVKIKFLEFPVFVISRELELAEGAEEKPSQPYNELEGLLYACGKSCLFSRKPRDLVANMQMRPLRIGIFRPYETFPIAEATVPLVGCLCDQVAMSGNDPAFWPKPYQLAGNYNLSDTGNNPAGSINISLRVSLFGPQIVTHFELHDKSCIFKNKYGTKMRVTAIEEVQKKSNEKDKTETEEKTAENKGEESGHYEIEQGTVLAVMQLNKKKKD